MLKFLVILVVSFRLNAFEDFLGQFEEYSINSQKPFEYLVQEKTPQIIIIHNLDGDSFAEVTVNKEKLYAASWMGIGGYYFIYLPPIRQAYTVQIHALNSRNSITKVGIQLYHTSNTQGIQKAFIKHSSASNYRYQQYIGGKDKRKKAIKLLDESIDIYKNNELDFFTALAAYEKAVILTELNKQTAAIESFNTAIKYWDKPQFMTQKFKSLNMKGLIYWKISQLTKALDIFRELLNELQIREQKELLAITLNNIGLIYWDQREITQAKKFFTKSLAINHVTINNLKKIPITEPVAATLNNLALTFDLLGEPNQAEILWQTHLNKFSSISNPNTIAKAKNNLASLYINKGKYEQSKQLLEEAITVFEKSNNKKWLSLSLYHLGRLYHKLGLEKLAEIQLQKSIALVDNINNPKDIIKPQLELLKLYTNQKKYSKIDDLEESIFQVAKQIDNKRTLALLSLNKFNQAISKQDYIRANITINQAITLSKNNSTQRYASNLLINKSKLLILQNKNSEAIELLKAEITKIKSIWDLQLLNMANNLLTQAYIRIQDLSSAETVINQEIDMLNFYISSTFNNNIKSNLKSMLKETLGLYTRIKTLQNKAEQGLITSNQMLRKLRRSQNNKQNKSSLSFDSIDELISTMSSKSLALENTNLSKDDREQIQNDMIELKAKLDFSYLANKNNNDKPLDIKNIQNNLDPETLVIQFSTSKVGSVSWWVTHNKIESFLLPNKGKLINLVSKTRNQLIQNNTSIEEINLISQILLMPLKKYPNIIKIQLVMDEPLNLIPFGALNDPRDNYKTPLSENSSVQRITNLISVSTQAQTTTNIPKALVIADPVTSIDDIRMRGIDAQNTFKIQNFPRLIGTKSEAKNIAKLLDASILQGFKASKKNLMLTDLKNTNILHFATHAFFHPTIPGLSSLVLSSFDKNGNQYSSFLRALEISSLKLNTNLVVLSGCETGMGREDKSLGMSGLTQAFMQAGVKNLIASLWKVNDRVTEKMMIEFYINYSNGMNASQALWIAQKSIKNNPRTRHPKYWAGWFLLSN